jgi:fermentation-respiration switch protein FrsA (DUF1100 family)
MALFLKLAGGAVFAYLLIVALAALAQRKLMYFPDPRRTPPLALALEGVKERSLAAGDGERIIAWHAQAAPGRPTLLYFHGNAGSLAARAERISAFMGAGLGVFMMSYRGYGGSTGRPSEAANTADAYLAYAALLEAGVSPEAVIVYGESLGTGVAVHVAAERACAGLVLEAPFTSMVELAARIYPLLPVRLLLADRYETDKVIPKVRIPVLILHGNRDDVVPVEMGLALGRIANAPKRVVVFPEGAHSDLYVAGNGALEALDAWITSLRR